MRIEVQGKNIEVTEELYDSVVSRFKRVGKQVPDTSTLEVKLSEERNPAIAEKYVGDATLFTKGTTLRAKEATPEMLHTIHELAEDIRRQVKRHREKLRKRHRTRRIVARMRGRTA